MGGFQTVFLSACALFSSFVLASLEPVPPAAESLFLSRECARVVTAFGAIFTGKEVPTYDVPPTHTDLMPVTAQEVDEAMRGFHELFMAVYGRDYVPETLGPVGEPLVRESRTVLSLFHASKRNYVPLQVLLGIEDRASAHLGRIELLRAKIRNLRSDLGPEVEYLTPSALAAVDIFREVGRSRNLAGGGARASLRPVARVVQDNLDEMFRSMSALAVFDDTLHDMLIVVADLVKRGKLNPSGDKKLKEAVHALIVSNFSVFDSKLPPEAVSVFKRYAGPRYGLTEEEASNLASSVDRVEKWQVKVEGPMQRFSETYYRGRIAYNVLSLMTRPNGMNGIALGSPMRDTMPSLECHPNVLNIAVRAYEGRKCYLNLSLGEMIDSDTSLRSAVNEHGMDVAERRLLGRMVRDDRMYWAFLRGYEYELRRTVELLETEQKARRLTFVGQIVGRVSGGITRERLNQTKFVRSILPGKFIDALVSQVETGTVVENTDPNAPRSTKIRRRKVQDLPPAVIGFLRGDATLAPWLEAAPVVVAPPVQDGLRNQPDDENSDRPERQQRQSQRQTNVTDENDSEPGKIPAEPNSGDVTQYVWRILDRLEGRAVQLLEADMNIQRESERTGRPIDHVAIGALAADIRLLLKTALRLQASVEASFRSLGISMEDAEETLAWHFLKRAPTLAMYVVSGPPGSPGIDPPVLTGQAGLGWRIVMLAPRLAYGDGVEDEPVFVQDPAADPHKKVRNRWKYIGIAVTSAAISVGGTKAFDASLKWMGVREAPPAPAVAPLEPGVKTEPNDEGEKPKDKALHETPHAP